MFKYLMTTALFFASLNIFADESSERPNTCVRLPEVHAITENEDSEESNLTGEIRFGLGDEYVWRGMEQHPDLVNQGQLSLSYELDDDMGTLGFTAWYNLSLTNEHSIDDFRFTELDYTFSWNKNIDERNNIELGYIHYDFPQATTNSNTSEIYAKWTYDYETFNPEITVYYDIDEGNGFYVLAGATREFKIIFDEFKRLDARETTLTVGAWIGWASADYYEENHGALVGESQTGLTDVKIGFTWNVPVTENISIEPYLYYQGLVDHARSNGYDDDNLSSGFTAVYTF